jgi:predicted HTH transcriptional regulator
VLSVEKGKNGIFTEVYNGFTLQPDFWSAEGDFKVTLYNRNEKVAEGASDSIYASIYALALEAGKITRKDVDDKFGFSTTKSFNLLKKICASGLLQQKKCGYQTVYVPKNKK